MHAWQHLGHFFSSQLSSKEFWAAIIGAVVGGLMTVIAAILAQKQAAKDQRQRDLQTEQRILNNILRSIAAELKVLKTGNFDDLEKKIKQQSKNREQAQKNNLNPPPPLAMKLTEQNYFIVFESNAAALGRIDDKNLREDIIKVYGNAKGLVDHLNTMGREFQIYRHLSDTDPKKQVVAGMLTTLEDQLLNGLTKLQEEVGTLLKKIEQYLPGNGEHAVSEDVKT